MIARGELIYDQSFPVNCSAAQFSATYPDIITQYPYGTQLDPGDRWPDGSVVTPAQAASSRYTGTFTHNVLTDPKFWPASIGPKVMNGFAQLHAYPVQVHQQSAVGGRRWASSMLRFPGWMTHGVVETRILIDGPPGCWDALASYTAEGGQNNEFDAMECLSGTINVNGTVLDRRGSPFTSLHPKGRPSISNNLEDRRATFMLGTGQWLTITASITPDECVVEYNGVEVFRQPTPDGFDKPRYWVLVRDIDPRQNPNPATFGASPMSVDYFRVFKAA